MMVRRMIVVGMTAAIIISMPFSISNVNTVATMIILPMVVAMMAMTIANVRGNEGGAASGREHGGAARNELDCWGGLPFAAWFSCSIHTS
jgi:hypothetical protein